MLPQYLLLPPITFDSVTILLAINTIVLLITIELTSTYYGHLFLVVNKRKLRKVLIVTGTLFLITAILQVVFMLIPESQNPLSWLSYG